MKRWPAEEALGLLVAVSPRPVTPEMLAAARGMTRKGAAKALATLARRGLAERAGRGRYQATEAGLRHALEGGRVASGPAGPTGPREGRRHTFQARLWAALRQLRKATVPELVQIAGRGPEHDPLSNARKYVRALVAAGYVSEMRRREPGAARSSNGFKRYLLARDPGPRAPVLNSNTRRLRDPNTGAVIDLATGQEVTP